MADVPLAVSPLPLDQLAGADAAADGTVPTADGAGGVAWETPGGGGGGGGSGLLAVHAYNPATIATFTPTTTMAALDTTNLRITFTPDTSQVIVVLTVSFVANGADAYFALFSGGTLVPGTSAFAAGGLSSRTRRAAWRVLATGLTPGVALTWDWAGYRTGPVELYAGGSRGQALMEIWSA